MDQLKISNKVPSKIDVIQIILECQYRTMLAQEPEKHPQTNNDDRKSRKEEPKTQKHKAIENKTKTEKPKIEERAREAKRNKEKCRK